MNTMKLIHPIEAGCSPEDFEKFGMPSIINDYICANPSPSVEIRDSVLAAEGFECSNVEIDDESTITIYRGISSRSVEALRHDVYPMSWTTERSIAEKFATDSGRCSGVVLTIRDCPTSMIAWYVGNERGESEALMDVFNEYFMDLVSEAWETAEHIEPHEYVSNARGTAEVLMEVLNDDFMGSVSKSWKPAEQITPV